MELTQLDQLLNVQLVPAETPAVKGLLLQLKLLALVVSSVHLLTLGELQLLGLSLALLEPTAIQVLLLVVQVVKQATIVQEIQSIIENFLALLGIIVLVEIVCLHLVMLENTTLIGCQIVMLLV